jgi:7,8-dihydroneopterin aldolase/epimerase/oxygenase
MSVRIEVHGLEVVARHGVDDDERQRDQRFFFDVELDAQEPAADEIGATVDYREVRDAVIRVSRAQAYSLLETLAAAVADALLEALRVDGVRVRVRKPGIAWAEWTAATVTRGAISS